MTTATLKATPIPAGDTATNIRITRALQTPGAKGKKGFLLWAVAAFPKAISDRIVKAAAGHLDAQMVSAVRNRAAGNASSLVGAPGSTQVGLGYAPQPVVQRGRMGNFRGFGDTTPSLVTVGVDTPDVSSSVSDAINATDSSAATPDWMSSISSAIQAAGQAYLTKTQVDAASQIFQTNLQRAQAGLPPIPTNPTQYGLPAPTVNLGLSSTTQSAVLWIAGGLGVILLFGMMGRRSSRR